MKKAPLFLLWPLLALCLGCAQQQPTVIPAVSTPGAYKEAAATALPGPVAAWSEAWWRAYNDRALDSLEQQLADNNPDLATALSRYEQARAATALVRSAQAPTVGASANVQRDRQADLRPLRGANQPDDYNSGTVGIDFQYELDVWGRIREQVRAGIADEHAVQADVAAARLTLQAQLADTLFALRGADAETALLRATLVAYGRATDLVARRHEGGIASGLDLARAQAQLASTSAQLRQLQGQRAVLEHAIATLVGANASTFSIQGDAEVADIPAVPLDVPSMLLERRPDIVAARLRIVAASARAGVARDAFFPALTLSGSAGFQSSDLARLASLPNLYWALGPGLAFNLFDGGRRKAQVADAAALLDQAGLRYRGIVLTAFQQVEDQLALLARYGEAAEDDRVAASAAQRALDLATNRYTEGAATYLEVVTAQTAHLDALRSALDLYTRRRRASVQLVRALGGGWRQAEHPSPVAG